VIKQKLLWVIIVIGFGLPFLIGCGNIEPIAELSDVQGTVSVKPKTAQNFSTGIAGNKISVGDVVKTERDSEATIKFLADETEIMLKSNTYLEIDKVAEFEIRQKSGIATYKISPQKKNIKITTPQGMATVLGTVLTIDAKENETTVSVEKGNVDFTKKDGSKINITEGRMYSTDFKENKARKILKTPVLKLGTDEVALFYGEGKNKVSYINENKYPGIEEPIPFGPLSFRIVDNTFWVADSVAGKLIQLTRENKQLREISVIPSNQTKPVPAFENDPCLQVLIEDFAPVRDENGTAYSFWVAESMENRLINVDFSGKIHHTITNPDFKQLYKVEIGEGGNIFVADKGAQRIFIYDKDLKFVEAVSWEWSGFAVSGDDDVLYRIFFTQETGLLTLVAQNREKQILRETELLLPIHLNPELCWVDESKQECLITYTPKTGFAGKFMVALVGFDGTVRKTTEMTAPIAMNRYIEKYNNKVWIADADFNTAPETLFKIKPFKLY